MTSEPEFADYYRPPHKPGLINAYVYPPYWKRLLGYWDPVSNQGKLEGMAGPVLSPPPQPSWPDLPSPGQPGIPYYGSGGWGTLPGGEGNMVFSIGAGYALFTLGTNYQRMIGYAWTTLAATPGSSASLFYVGGILFHRDGTAGIGYWSSDLGASWTAMTKAAGIENMISIRRSPSGRFWCQALDTTPNPDVHYAVYSDDFGATWTFSDGPVLPVTGPNAAGICVHPTDSNRILNAADASNNSNFLTLRVTTDGGTSWTTRTASSEAAFNGGSCFWLSSGRILATYFTTGSPSHFHVRSSDDDGANWTTRLDLTLPGVGSTYVTAFIPAGAGAFFALDLDSALNIGLIYRSPDGATWEALDTLASDSTPIYGLAYNEIGPSLTRNSLFIHLSNGVVARVANADTVAAVSWLDNWSWLPSSDSGAKSEGIVAL